eukprot:TRINITY_DN2449_c0_g1_i1.p1 TRINITY_DN2449_c0_g1~~TRINITY_DN2449_c0_g1_i1.p1  ORF type:complete len:374 (+),score=86.50 TRINITY_DN2449_c0_g1_i1:56-1177(+)
MPVPKTMKVLTKDKDVVGYEMAEVEVPAPGDHQTLVKITKVGVCGSDIPLHDWTDVGKSIATLPFTPGHEAVGVVVQIGAGVQPMHDLTPGDRVGVENHYYCEKCHQCRHGQPHICSFMGQLGHGKLGHGPGMDATIAKQGGCAEYALVPTKMLYKLKYDITDVQACLLEPMGVAHNGCEAAEVTKGDDVLITGCGAIGLLAVQICKAMGASKIIIADIDEKKLQMGIRFGADIAINTLKQDLKTEVMNHTEGFGVGHLVECSGAGPIVDTCFESVRKGGNMCLLGLPKKPIRPQEPGKDFLFRCRTIRSVHGRKIFHTWEQCEKLIATGACQPELIVTHDFPLSSYQEAFGALLGGKGIKILMTPETSSPKL